VAQDNINSYFELWSPQHCIVSYVFIYSLVFYFRSYGKVFDKLSSLIFLGRDTKMFRYLFLSSIVLGKAVVRFPKKNRICQFHGSVAQRKNLEIFSYFAKKEQGIDIVRCENYNFTICTTQYEKLN
jgi:hypothetical protein